MVFVLFFFAWDYHTSMLHASLFPNSALIYYSPPSNLSLHIAPRGSFHWPPSKVSSTPTSISSVIYFSFISSSTVCRRRWWHPTTVLLPGKSHGRRSWWAAVHGVTRVGRDWATSLSLFTFMHWRRKWQPTPVFLPGVSQGRGSLVGCSPLGR